MRLNQQGFHRSRGHGGQFCRLRRFIAVDLFIPARAKTLLEEQPHATPSQATGLLPLAHLRLFRLSRNAESPRAKTGSFSSSAVVRPAFRSNSLRPGCGWLPRSFIESNREAWTNDGGEAGTI